MRWAQFKVGRSNGDCGSYAGGGIRKQIHSMGRYKIRVLRDGSDGEHGGRRGKLQARPLKEKMQINYQTN